MAGQAGNISAFNTVWTYDVYRAIINKNASDANLMWVGRISTVVGGGPERCHSVLGEGVPEHHGLHAGDILMGEIAPLFCDDAAPHVRRLEGGRSMERSHARL